MIDVALLGIIRRWHLRDQIPIREIARRLGISRNTVRRYLRSETTEPSYAERRSATGLDKYSVLLSSWLKVEATRPRKQRRNLKQLHLELKELGYGGSYDRVAAFARRWKEGQLEWVNSASKRTPWHHNGNRPYLDLLKTILLCYIAGKKYEKAVEWCDMIKRADPDDSCGIRFVFGHVLLRSGEHEKAQAWFADHGTEYSPYFYELGLCFVEQEKFIEAATAFRRGIAINPYIAELIFNGHRPNPYAIMHFWANEEPPLAAQYLGAYGAIWEEALVAQRFLYWLFNQSNVMAERSRLMACREQRSLDLDLPPPEAQVAHYRSLLAAIDDKLSFDIVQRRPNGDGEMEWPWQVYR